MKNYYNQNHLEKPMGFKPFRIYSKAYLEGLLAKNASEETVNGYGKDLEMVNRFLEERYNGLVVLADVQTKDLEDYLANLRTKKNYQPASVNRHLNTLRSFYNYAVKKGWTTYHAAAPIDQLKVPKKERTFIEEDEYKELVNAIEHPTIKTVIQFLYYTGLRITECLSLTLDEVNLERKTVHVKNGKGNKERVVPINDKLLPILVDYVESIRPSVDSNRFFALKKTGKVSDVYVDKICWFHSKMTI
ncbi:tyrosine-type recombinase/integrase [Bacillus seohaeanensis]|uniref:Tyrosine-type recombinase/integrase n=1 Tax=Bacillus seohaeanensis TaxID=284580 RepID=A0ABW5RLK9_9BACI